MRRDASRALLRGIDHEALRAGLKRQLARAASPRRPLGATLLIYHRVGGGSADELDVPAARFAQQLDALRGGLVVSLDAAVDRLRRGVADPSVVLTFDDGFADVYRHAWLKPRARGLPFTVYLTSGCVGGRMRWAGSTARQTGAPALTWDQLAEMAASGLCTVANHTRSHARPQALTCAERIAARGVAHLPLHALTRAWNPRRDLAAARELAALLRRLRPDVLHTHNPKSGVLGRIAGSALAVPVVANTCHGLWAQARDPLPKRALAYAAEGLAAAFSHAELYQNADDRRTLRAAVPAWRSRTVGNGVDLSRFRSDPAARARVRAELGLAGDELLVGGVGRRVAEKGIREFAAAARALAGKARFVWAGPQDPDKPDALDRADEAAAGARFLGERQDMAGLYAALDVFVLPSYREGFSRSAMEAAACGLPMVLSDIRGCREIGRDREHLLLVPAGAAAELTAAVDRLLTDPPLRLRLGEAAARRAHTEFDQRRIARISMETYAAVARRRSLGWTGS